MRKILTLLFLFLTVVSQARVREYSIEVVNKYPHSRQAYTQGLFFLEGRLIESTGLYGKSVLREVDLESGKDILRKPYKGKYFLEGSVVFEGKIYLLSWTNHMVFVHDPKTFAYLSAYSYPREGWGLTSDGKYLIASDGSSNIYYMDGSLKMVRTLKVTLNGRPVKMLNELEYIDGEIWANVYLTDMIIRINPSNGEVTGVVDCRGLLRPSERDADTDVLNGIAFEKSTGKIYITGKCWPFLYEIRLIETR